MNLYKHVTPKGQEFWSKYQVGDHCYLEDPGYTYPIYDTMFKIMGFKNTTINFLPVNVKWEKLVWEVFAIHPHENVDRTLIGISRGEIEILINEEGTSPA